MLSRWSRPLRLLRASGVLKARNVGGSKPSAGGGGDKWKDPYSVLGADSSESLDAIRAKHRKLVAQFHPDRMSSASPAEKEAAEKRMLELNVALDRIASGDVFPPGSPLGYGAGESSSSSTTKGGASSRSTQESARKARAQPRTSAQWEHFLWNKPSSLSDEQRTTLNWQIKALLAFFVGLIVFGYVLHRSGRDPHYDADAAAAAAPNGTQTPRVGGGSGAALGGVTQGTGAAPPLFPYSKPSGGSEVSGGGFGGGVAPAQSLGGLNFSSGGATEFSMQQSSVK